MLTDQSENLTIIIGKAILYRPTDIKCENTKLLKVGKIQSYAEVRPHRLLSQLSLDGTDATG